MVLYTILKKLKRKEKEIRILILGLDNAGKTTVVKKLNGEDTNTISPTLGFNITTLLHNGFNLNLVDVGGQKSIRTYWKNYFESTDALIWVVDSADKMRIKNCKAELHNLIQEEQIAGATVLILANKQDLDGSLNCDEIAKQLDLDEIKSTHHCCILPCSALKGDNLLKGMNWLIEDVSNRIFSF